MQRQPQKFWLVARAKALFREVGRIGAKPSECGVVT